MISETGNLDLLKVYLNCTSRCKDVFQIRIVQSGKFDLRVEVTIWSLDHTFFLVKHLSHYQQFVRESTDSNSDRIYDCQSISLIGNFWHVRIHIRILNDLRWLHLNFEWFWAATIRPWIVQYLQYLPKITKYICFLQIEIWLRKHKLKWKRWVFKS